MGSLRINHRTEHIQHRSVVGLDALIWDARLMGAFAGGENEKWRVREHRHDSERPSTPSVRPSIDYYSTTVPDLRLQCCVVVVV